MPHLPLKPFLTKAPPLTFPSPRLLSYCVCPGSGAQLFAMAAVTLTFALLGFMSPANRGGLLTSLLLLFVFMGTPHHTTSKHETTHSSRPCRVLDPLSSCPG